MDDAEKGIGRVVFISGEGGVGKTRLAASAAEAAAARGWSVAVGRAYPVETGVPYALFSDALLPLIRKIGPPALAVLTRGGAAELSHLFPALGEAGAKGTMAGLDASELKARLLWNFSQFLGRLAAKKPLLILLDNLQWADAETVEVVEYLADNIADQPILCLVSLRNEEPSAALSRVRSLVARRSASILELQKLSAEEVTSMAAGCLQSLAIPRDLAQVPLARAHGLPFLV